MIKYGMYNWSDNIPTLAEKNQFYQALDQVKHKEKPRILEIGTYTGSSIMEIKNYIPHAECIAIDNWGLEPVEVEACSRIAGEPINMSMVRNAFFQNTRGMVKIIEMDSVNALVKLSSENSKFDFIYVDGSHRAGDTLMDLCLSWVLLNEGGILAIDDYGFIPEVNPEDRTMFAVDLFMKKLSGKYITLYKGYRVFLKKI